METSTASSASAKGDPDTDSPVNSKDSFGANVIPFIERMWLLFCCYTLSIGPLYWQWLDGYSASGSKILAAFYEPLRRLGSLIPLFGDWLNWYVRLWIF